MMIIVFATKIKTKTSYSIAWFTTNLFHKNIENVLDDKVITHVNVVG